MLTLVGCISVCASFAWKSIHEIVEESLSFKKYIELYLLLTRNINELCKDV